MTVEEPTIPILGRDNAVGIRLEGVSKRFRGGVDAIVDFDLEIDPGEFVVLVGPSGCGKSTLLRMIAGLEEVSGGRIFIGGADVTTKLAQQRDVAMVFQSYALYPRMSVFRNMAFGLRMRHTPKAERTRRVNEVARMLGLEQLLDRRPAALSGGQRQRAAMGRALVREPRVFLLDEPLSNLDAKLRVSLRAQLSLLHERLGITTVYVTHDQVEAMTLGQRVAVLRDGTLQQFDTPQHLYQSPVNLFVAAFIGSPAMNFAHGVVADGAVRFAGATVPLPHGSSELSRTREVIVGIRPTAFSTDLTRGWQVVVVAPDLVEELGDERYVIFGVDSPRVDTDATRAAVSARTDDETLLAAEDRARFTARLMTEEPIERGEPLRLAINPERLHFFDPETNLAVGMTPAWRGYRPNWTIYTERNVKNLTLGVDLTTLCGQILVIRHRGEEFEKGRTSLEPQQFDVSGSGSARVRARSGHLPLDTIAVCVVALGVAWYVTALLVQGSASDGQALSLRVARIDTAASTLAILAGSAHAVRWKIDGYAPAWWIGNSLFVAAVAGITANTASPAYSGLHLACALVAACALALALHSQQVDTGIRPALTIVVGGVAIGVLYVVFSRLPDHRLAYYAVAAAFAALAGATTKRWRLAPDEPWASVVPFAIGFAVAALGAASIPLTNPIRDSGSVFLRLAVMSVAAVGAIADLHAAAALQRHAAYREHLGRAVAEQQRQTAENQFAETLHEVRSTVVALEGGLRCLSPDDDPEPSAALTRALTSEVERLRSLVSDEPPDTCASYVVLDALEPMLTVSRVGGVPVSWEIPGSLAINGRAADLAQIVQGLLTNAIRHAPGAPVDVTAEADGGYVVVRVSDRGPGVPRGERELIFERGARGRNAENGGGGLGLYVARNIARTHGGDVWVEQCPGGGSSFAVALPAAAAADLPAFSAEAKHDPVVRPLARPAAGARDRRGREKAPS